MLLFLRKEVNLSIQFFVSKKKCLLSFSRKCSICMCMIHCSIQTYPVTVDEVYFFVFTTDDVALSSFPLQSIYVVKDVEKGTNNWRSFFFCCCKNHIFCREITIYNSGKQIGLTCGKSYFTLVKIVAKNNANYFLRHFR